MTSESESFREAFERSRQGAAEGGRPEADHAMVALGLVVLPTLGYLAGAGSWTALAVAVLVGALVWLVAAGASARLVRQARQWQSLGPIREFEGLYDRLGLNPSDLRARAERERKRGRGGNGRTRPGPRTRS